jgi:hypothetical protein
MHRLLIDALTIYDLLRVLIEKSRCTARIVSQQSVRRLQCMITHEQSRGPDLQGILESRLTSHPNSSSYNATRQDIA